MNPEVHGWQKLTGKGSAHPSLWFFGALRHSQVDTKALLIVLSVTVSLSIARAVHFWVTGFFIPDEVGYWGSAMKGEYTNVVLGHRYLFGIINAALVSAFNIYDASKLALFLAFYSLIWNCLTLFMVFKILRLLDVQKRISAITIFSFVLILSYVLLSPTFLTEPVSLAFAMSGLYFLLRCVKHPRIDLSVFSAFSFGAALFVRESYALALAGAPFVILIPLMTSDVSGWHSKGTLGAKLRNISLKVLEKGKNRKRVSYKLYPFLVSLVVSLTLLHYPIPQLGMQTTQMVTVFVTELPEGVVSSATRLQSLVSSAFPGLDKTPVVTLPPAASTKQPDPVDQISSILNTSPKLNAFRMVMFSLLLGYGPVLFIVLSIGFIILVRRALKRRKEALTVLPTVLIWLLSIYGLMLPFSGEGFFVFRHFSTLFRFSHMTIPAYVMLAPLAFSAVAKTTRSAFVVVLLLIIGTGLYIPLALPAAQSFISPHGENRLEFTPQTDWTVIRDYVRAHPEEAPFHIVARIGAEEAFVRWTPGTNDLVGLVNFHPYLSEEEFLAKRWNYFYLDVHRTELESTRQVGWFKENRTYLLPFLGIGDYQGSKQYSISKITVIVDNEESYFARVDLRWFDRPS